MEQNLNESIFGTGASDACIAETGKIIGQCNQYAASVMTNGILIGAVVGAVGMLVFLWWWNGRQN